MPVYDLIIVGGGAAGFFAALTAAEASAKSRPRILILEKSQRPLAKVRISGGGRCNLTHACFDPAELVGYYPRGSKELRGPLTRFGPAEALEWFDNHGVATKAEPDGRMFPASNRSQTVIDCLLEQAHKQGIELRTRQGVSGLQVDPNGFRVQTPDGSLDARQVLLAPGGGTQSAYQLAARLGHTIVPPVPSLFTFNIRDPRLKDIPGVSVPTAALSLHPGAATEKPFTAHGPLLVTHWGLSGPAVLKLSAWAARALADSNYRAELRVNWQAGQTSEAQLAVLQTARDDRPRQTIAKGDPDGRLPQRLWRALVAGAGLESGQTWAQSSNADLQRLAEQLTQASFQVHGKAVFKDEFVTCGGVNLKEVDFRTMQSRLIPGLYFAGEYLDIDALTGGFNFQAAWTTGWVAGRAIAGQIAGTIKS